MKLEWRPRAVADLENIRAWIASGQPAAAERIASHVLSAAEMLRDYPFVGRTGRAPKTRELVIRGTPYLLIYRHARDTITVLRVLHGAQRWPQRRP